MYPIPDSYYSILTKKRDLYYRPFNASLFYITIYKWFTVIGHFRVAKPLIFKLRLGVQPFLWKWVLFAWDWKIISISKVEHLTSFWYRGPGELGNGLLLSKQELLFWNKPRPRLVCYTDVPCVVTQPFSPPLPSCGRSVAWWRHKERLFSTLPSNLRRISKLQEFNKRRGV